VPTAHTRDQDQWFISFCSTSAVLNSENHRAKQIQNTYKVQSTKTWQQCDYSSV